MASCHDGVLVPPGPGSLARGTDRLGPGLPRSRPRALGRRVGSGACLGRLRGDETRGMREVHEPDQRPQTRLFVVAAPQLAGWLPASWPVSVQDGHAVAVRRRACPWGPGHGPPVAPTGLVIGASERGASGRTNERLVRAPSWPPRAGGIASSPGPFGRREQTRARPVIQLDTRTCLCGESAGADSPHAWLRRHLAAPALDNLAAAVSRANGASRFKLSLLPCTPTSMAWVRARHGTRRTG